MKFFKMSHPNIHCYCSCTFPTPALPPYLPPSSKHTHQICQCWERVTLHAQGSKAGSVDVRCWDGEWERKDSNQTLGSILHSLYICTHTRLFMHFRILTNFSHGREMRSSCPACGDDNKNIWPELAPHWQWRLRGFSCPEELASYDSPLHSIKDPH